MKWKVKFGSSSLGKNLRFRAFGIIFEVSLRHLSFWTAQNSKLHRRHKPGWAQHSSMQLPGSLRSSPRDCRSPRPQSCGDQKLGGYVGPRALGVVQK
jgi:hypothetical protein